MNIDALLRSKMKTLEHAKEQFSCDQVISACATARPQLLAQLLQLCDELTVAAEVLAEQAGDIPDDDVRVIETW